MNYKFFIKLILLVIIYLTFGGCNQGVQENTDLPYSNSLVPDKAYTPQKPIDKQDENNKVSFDSKNILDKLTIENLNNEDQMEVYIYLPSEWGAIPTQYEGQYTIINKAGERIGEWMIIGQSPNQLEGYLPNHIVTQEKKVIQTKLGKGGIYQLELDLPEQERTNVTTTYHMVYVLIPINKTNQSYNFFVEVPYESIEKYVKLVENMLR